MQIPHFVMKLTAIILRLSVHRFSLLRIPVHSPLFIRTFFPTGIICSSFSAFLSGTEPVTQFIQVFNCGTQLVPHCFRIMHAGEHFLITLVPLVNTEINSIKQFSSGNMICSGVFMVSGKSYCLLDQTHVSFSVQSTPPCALNDYGCVTMNSCNYNLESPKSPCVEVDGQMFQCESIVISSNQVSFDCLRNMSLQNASYNSGKGNGTSTVALNLPQLFTCSFSIRKMFQIHRRMISNEPNKSADTFSSIFLLYS